MSELSPEARDIIAAARGGDDPSPADRQRVGAALMAAIAAGAGSSATAHAASTANAGAGTSLSGTSLPLGAKILAGVVLAGGVGLGGYMLLRDSGQAAPRSAHVQAAAPEPPAPEPEPAVAAAPAEVSAEPVAAPSAASEERGELPEEITEETTEPVVAERKRLRRAAAAESRRPAIEPREPASAPVAPADAADVMTTLRAERALVARAKTALDAGDAERALAALEQHAQRFPSGVLTEERAALRVIALCAGGEPDAGAREQASFLASWPTSPYAARVRGACPTRP